MLSNITEQMKWAVNNGPILSSDRLFYDVGSHTYECIVIDTKVQSRDHVSLFTKWFESNSNWKPRSLNR